MRKVLIALAVSAAALASPAFAAGEGRIEARGGIFWTDGYDQATAGVAAGYDFDIAENAFIGGEVSADKVLDDGTDVTFGFTGRVGGKTSSNGRVYVAGGYTDDFQSGTEHAWHAGLGYEQGLAGSLYGKVEYRHYFIDTFQDANAAVVGLGMRF